MPDAKTIWMFRERLTRAGAIDGCSGGSTQRSRSAGYIAMSGQLVDSSLMAAPKQRNTRDEKRAIKAGKSAHEIWPDQPANTRQKDVDARWTIQTGKARRDGDRTLLDIAIPSFGTKAHTSIDRRYRLIRCWEVTDASRHDGQLLRQSLLDPREHRRRRLGRHRVSIAAERDVPGATWVHQPHSPPTPARPTAPGTHPPRQCHPLTRPRSGRAHVRGAEASHGTDRPHDRSRPSPHEDRHGRPRLQHPSPRPARRPDPRLTVRPGWPSTPTS